MNFSSIKQTGFLGLWGESIDAVDFYTAKIERLARDVSDISFYPCILLFTSETQEINFYLPRSSKISNHGGGVGDQLYIILLRPLFIYF